MDPTMNICVVGEVVLSQRFDYLNGLLTGCGIIQVNQWVAVNGLVQDRKVLPQVLKGNLPAFLQIRFNG
jgi:hypothetical protein